MSKETRQEHTPNEMAGIIKDVIQANEVIMKQGNKPIALSVVGPHGIGKTTVIREVVNELGKDLYKLNFAQLTEPAELIGHFSKEYQIKKGDDVLWITENMIPEYYKLGYARTGVTKSVPCPPEYIVNLKQDGVLLVDDFSRGNSLLMQAMMELVEEGSMIGWNLRDKNISVILSENPEDGEYNVQSVDAAHTSRMAKYHMRWEAKDWAERAEKIGLDERLINFVLWKPELLEKKKVDGISASGNVSPREMDKFFALVGTLDDFEKQKDKVVLFGDGTVGKDITADLLNFVSKKLDKLPSIEKLIREKKSKTDENHWDLSTAKAALTECCGDAIKDSNNWRAATSAILSMRIANYCIHYHRDLSKDEIKRVGELAGHTSFGVDQRYMIVKKLVGLGNTFAMVLAGNPDFIAAMKQ